jgi:hypothetical protein
LKWGGLAVAVFGVIALYADVTVLNLMIAEKPPLVSLTEVTPSMNFAIVRIQGTVTGVSYDEARMWLGITLMEENETIFIRVYDSETKALIERNKVPAVGDKAEVTGQLRVRPGFRQMILQVAGGLRPERPQAQPMTIGNVLENVNDLLYQRVRIENVKYLGEKGPLRTREGRVWATWVVVEDIITENRITILLPHYPWTKRFEELDIESGQTLSVSGAVSLYFDQVQILPAKPLEDIRVIR